MKIVVSYNAGREEIEEAVRMALKAVLNMKYGKVFTEEIEKDKKAMKAIEESNMEHIKNRVKMEPVEVKDAASRLGDYVIRLSEMAIEGPEQLVPFIAQMWHIEAQLEQLIEDVQDSH